MDRTEAIEHLKVILKTCDVQDEEAVEMAIAALKQPEIIHCEECLYRKICSWQYYQGAMSCSIGKRGEAE